MRHPRWVGIKCWEPVEYSLCLFAGGVFKHTAFLLAFWPSAHFVCWEKKKISVSCPVIPSLTYLVFRLHGRWSAALELPSTHCFHAHTVNRLSKSRHVHVLYKIFTRNKLAPTLCLFPDLWSADLVRACRGALIYQHAALHQSCFLNADSFFQWSVALTVSTYFSFIARLMIPRCSQTWSTKTYHKQAILCFIPKHKRTMCLLA